MTTPSLVLRTGDTLPVLTVTVEEDGTPVDLTGAAVVLHLTDESGSTVTHPMTLADQMARPGVCIYAWQPGDTAGTVSWSATFVVTFPGGGVQTFPAGQPTLIEVVGSPAAADPRVPLLRRWVGSNPADDELLVLLAAHGGRVAETAQSILGIRLADLLAAPASFGVAGQINVSTSANILALRERLADLAPLVTAERSAAGLPALDGTAVITSRVTRPDAARWPVCAAGRAF